MKTIGRRINVDKHAMQRLERSSSNYLCQEQSRGIQRVSIFIRSSVSLYSRGNYCCNFIGHRCDVKQKTHNSAVVCNAVVKKTHIDVFTPSKSGSFCRSSYRQCYSLRVIRDVLLSFTILLVSIVLSQLDAVWMFSPSTNACLILPRTCHNCPHRQVAIIIDF